MLVDSSDYAHVDLHTVLSDPSSLAYWLEFMERGSRSRLVQFWLTVEGFKDPLEGIGQNATLDGTLIASDVQTTQSAQTVFEDVSFLRETYFTSTNELLSLPARHVAVIDELVQAGRLAPSDVRRAKQAMFACQQAVYDQMQEEDWAGFKKSELYIKACSDLSKGSLLPRSPVNSPKTSSFPFLPTSPAPPVPLRQQTAPVLPPRKALQARESTSPPLRALPSLNGGQFTPTSATPAASVSLSPPDLDRRVSEMRPSMSHHLSHRNDSPSSSPATPSVNARRSIQLDFLIGDESEKVTSKLFDDEEEGGEDRAEEEDDDFVQIQRMEAIQAALNEIIASDDMISSRTLKRESTSPTPDTKLPQPSMSSSMVLSPKPETIDPLGKIVSRSVEDLRAVQPTRTYSSAPSSRVASGRPGLTHRNSLSELNKRSKLLFDDEVIDEDPDDAGGERDDEEGLPQTSFPSDAQLGGEIARMQDKIQELVKQEHLLDTLIRQAELTGNAAELRILNRSQASVRREQRTAIFQKAQLEQHEEEGRIVAGLTAVSIPIAVTVSEDGDGGKQVVRYSITVRQGQADAENTHHWTVTRRYNEFWELDRGLRDWAGNNGHAALLKGMDELPPKKLVPNLSASFIDSRRQGLEKYLQVSVLHPLE
jgi:sorting nexin-25